MFASGQSFSYSRQRIPNALTNVDIISIIVSFRSSVARSAAIWAIACTSAVSLILKLSESGVRGMPLNTGIIKARRSSGVPPSCTVVYTAVRSPITLRAVSSASMSSQYATHEACTFTSWILGGAAQGSCLLPTPTLNACACPICAYFTYPRNVLPGHGAVGVSYGKEKACSGIP